MIKPNYGLWSLWEMLEKHTLLFIEATEALSTAKWLCQPLQLKPGERQVSRQEIENICRFGVVSIRRACILSDMLDVLPELNRLASMILPNEGQPFPTPQIPPAPLDSIAQAINHLVLRIKDELNAHYYFHLDTRDVRFYLDKEPFGPEVTKKFSNATEDIDEAGKCLALQRSIACVFHLMRVMEIGVQKFGEKLGVSLIDSRGKEKNWQNILDQSNKAIRALADRNDPLAQKYAEVSGLLYLVKLAWRNEVMHPKQTYSRDEALEIFNASKIFMEHLVSVL